MYVHVCVFILYVGLRVSSFSSNLASGGCKNLGILINYVLAFHITYFSGMIILIRFYYFLDTNESMWTVVLFMSVCVHVYVNVSVFNKEKRGTICFRFVCFSVEKRYKKTPFLFAPAQKRSNTALINVLECNYPSAPASRIFRLYWSRV